MTQFFKFFLESHKTLVSYKFTAAEWRLYLYLSALDPFGDEYVELPNTQTILSECELKKSNFYIAMARLQELNLFDFQDKGFHYRNLQMDDGTKLESSPKSWKRFKNSGREIGIESKILESESKKLESESKILEKTIYTEDQTSQTSSAREKKKDEANSLDLENSLENKLANEIDLEKENELENSLDLESATTRPTLSEIPKTEIQSLAKSESGSVEKFSAVVGAPEKPKPKPRPQIKAWESWPPAGPWNINGQLDMNFRDAIAQSWVVAYGGDVHKKKADVLRHFKKDPDNLAIAWEQYQSEYLNRYETTQILMTNGIEIPQEYQRRLINNQRAITQSLPPEINLITAPVIPDSIGPMSSLGGVVKPLALTEAIQTTQTTQTAERTTIKTEDGKTYQTYQKPVLENPATPEQMGEMLERIKAFTQGGRMGQRKPVVELTEEAIALEKEAKKTNYLANLNEMLKDPILRKEAMKEAFKREDLQFLFDDDGTPYQVTYAEC
jgi:hypothetical protein